MPPFMLTVDSNWQWTPEPKVMIPGDISNKDLKFSSHTSFNKLLTVDLMWRWTPGCVVFIPAINSNTYFIGLHRLFRSLWIQNNGPLDSSTHGFDPGHKFKHVISSNMPSFFAHCGFNNGPVDSRIRGFQNLIPAKNSNTLFHRIWRLFCSLWI